MLKVIYIKARIALLEGERRGVENIKLTLMKRVKMLEYALRQERYAVMIVSVGCCHGGNFCILGKGMLV